LNRGFDRGGRSKVAGVAGVMLLLRLNVVAVVPGGLYTCVGVVERFFRFESTFPGV
jgi:hypothetical protein